VIPYKKSRSITGDVFKPSHLDLEIIFEAKAKEWLPTGEDIDFKAEFVFSVSVALNEFRAALFQRTKRVDKP
jgi:hypothetical protein